MKDPILLNNLYREVDAGRATVSYSGDLAIFKYTQDTHINDEWNEVNRLARGIIFHHDGTIVARPFAKFFNLHEREETMPSNLPWHEGVEVYEKVDGSCGTGYLSFNVWHLATPGSMESDQAVEGTHMLDNYDMVHMPTDCTPVFEIVYPENRIVVDYHGARELVLLAIFEHNGVEWHPRRVDQIAQACGFRRPKRYDIDVQNDKVTFEDNSEGYVFRFGDGTRVKSKSPIYMRIHRLLDRLTPKGVVELIRGKEYRATIEQLPKEIARDFDDMRAYVQGLFNTIKADAWTRLAEMEGAIGPNKPRKEYARWVQSNVPNAEGGFVFALLDQKDIEDKVWKLVLERMKDETTSCSS